MAEVCEEECMGRSPRYEPLVLKRWHSCGLPQIYKAFGLKSVCDRTYNIKGIKGKFSLFSFIS